MRKNSLLLVCRGTFEGASRVPSTVSHFKTERGTSLEQLELDMEQQTGSKLGKEYIKAILSPCSFNLRAEYLMRNAGLDEAQAGIKIAGRNSNNLMYADTTLMVESEELKSLLMKVKEESEKVYDHSALS